MNGTFLPALTGSFSQPAGDNPTVAIVEAAYAHHQIHARYINCEVASEDLAAAVTGAWAMGWWGFNASMPHKVAVIPHLIGLGESARVIGAVNCAVRTPDGFRGENTDGAGFLTSLRTLIDPTGTTAVIYGAGGAARACAVELALAGAAAITIVNRNAERGSELARLINDHTTTTARAETWDHTHRVPEGVDVVLNATSVGLAPHGDAMLDLDPSSLSQDLVVADVVFNPSRTRLLIEAERRGARTLSGRGMLVNQAVLGISHWTGVEVEAAVMRTELDRLLGDEMGDEIGAQPGLSGRQELS